MSNSDGFDRIRLEIQGSLNDADEKMRKRCHDIRADFAAVVAELQTGVRTRWEECAVRHTANAGKIHALETLTEVVSKSVAELREWKAAIGAGNTARDRDIDGQLNDFCDRLGEAEKMLEQIKMTVGEGRIRVGVMWSIMAFIGTLFGGLILQMLKAAQ